MVGRNLYRKKTIWPVILTVLVSFLVFYSLHPESTLVSAVTAKQHDVIRVISATGRIRISEQVIVR